MGERATGLLVLLVSALSLWAQDQPSSPPSLTGCAQSFSPPAITVWGTELSSDSTLAWNASPVAATPVGGTQLTAPLPAGAGPSSDGAIVSVVSGGVVSNCLSVVAVPPLLLISSSPARMDATAAAFSIAVNGSGFIPGSAVVWANTPVATTFVSSSQLTAAVPAGAGAASGLYNVAVVNPDGRVSNVISISLQPVLSALTPNSLTVNQSGAAIAATGAGFVSTDVLALSLPGGPLKLATTFVSSTALTAAIPASALSLAFQAAVTVSDSAAPLSSVALPLTIGRPPGIATLNPGSAVVGGAAFKLVVNGTGFASGAIIQWNGVGLPTAFVSDTQMTAAVSADAVASPQTALVTVAVPGGLSNTVAFPVVVPPPSMAAAGVVNAASLAPSIAPGSVISIFGSNLAPASATVTAYPAPTSLNGVTVTVNGQNAPLLYVDPSQINAQVPFETPVGPATLVIDVAGQKSSPAAFVVEPAAPGIFADPQSNHAVAQNYPDYSQNSPVNPISPGQYVVVYMTGQGALDTPVATGALPPADHAVNALAAAEAKIGGQPATIQFLGLAPGLVGIAQMNLLVPNVPSGDQLLEISVGGVAANTSLISIKSQ